MPKQKLRESIAREAARLILRGKEGQFASARKRAARWRSRRKVHSDDLPSYSEIQSQLYAQAGLFSTEIQTAGIRSMRESSLELMDLLRAYHPSVSGCAVDGPVLEGSEIEMSVSAESADDVMSTLGEAGLRPSLVECGPSNAIGNRAADSERMTRIRLNHRYGCVIDVHLVSGAENAEGWEQDDNVLPIRANSEQLRALMASPPQVDVESDEPTDDDDRDYHPDLFRAIHMLLSRLETVQLPSTTHPEGDALYHSLQTYELGLQHRAYDEEFLLACLLHDAGLAIDRRNPVPVLLSALGGLVSSRTGFLIEHRAAAREYLRTGKIARFLRRSDQFEDLRLLARCDLDARVPGARVSSIDEALEYIAGLESAWDYA